MRKFTEKQLVAMASKHNAVLDTFDPIYEETDPYSGARSYTFDTMFGKLVVKSYGDWIATRFVDPQRVPAYLQANPYSGKWNHHWNWSKGDAEGKLVFARFIRELQAIMIQKN